IFGLTLDEKKPLVWPLNDNGTLHPRPDDCLGLEPIRSLGDGYPQGQYWRGWLVWWKTPAGNRAAFMDTFEATQNYEALMASKSQAKWMEWQTFYNNDTRSYNDIRREAGVASYEVLHNNQPVSTTGQISTIAQGQDLIAKV